MGRRQSAHENKTAFTISIASGESWVVTQDSHLSSESFYSGQLLKKMFKVKSLNRGNSILTFYSNLDKALLLGLPNP